MVLLKVDIQEMERQKNKLKKKNKQELKTQWNEIKKKIKQLENLQIEE